MKNPLKKLFRHALRGSQEHKRTENFGRNTAILNTTPKNHQPRKKKVIQK